MSGNTSMRNLEGHNSFPMGTNFTQLVLDDRQASVLYLKVLSWLNQRQRLQHVERKNIMTRTWLIKKIWGKITARKSSERKRRQAPTKKSVISKIKVTVNTSEVTRASKKRKAESSAKEKAEVLESSTKTGKRQGCNNKITKAQNITS